MNPGVGAAIAQTMGLRIVRSNSITRPQRHLDSQISLGGSIRESITRVVGHDSVVGLARSEILSCAGLSDAQWPITSDPRAALFAKCASEQLHRRGSGIFRNR